MARFIEFRHLSKTYTVGEVKINALHDANFVIDEGELCVIVGPSGAGKTTLLNILGGMDTLSEGEVFVGGRDISHLGIKDLTAYRRYEVGFVFQFYNLIQNLTALENVEMATHISHVDSDAAEVLAEVGLAERCRNFPAQLSGGEQQRVSIARALAKKPRLLLCDEPTGALDYVTGKQILRLLQDTARNTGMTGVIIPHNSALTATADRSVRVKNGTVEQMELNPDAKSVDEIEW